MSSSLMRREPQWRFEERFPKTWWKWSKWLQWRERLKNVWRYFASKNQTTLNNFRIIIKNMRIILSKIVNLNYFLNFVFSHQILSFRNLEFLEKLGTDCNDRWFKWWNLWWQTQATKWRNEKLEENHDIQSTIQWILGLHISRNYYFLWKEKSSFNSLS